jgi:hypothetical protein
MAIKSIRKWTRPSANVPFYGVFREELQAHIKKTYDDTGKRLSLETSKSEDGLEFITISIWKDTESHSEFINDPEIIESGSMVAFHNSVNNIIQTFESSEI